MAVGLTIHVDHVGHSPQGPGFKLHSTPFRGMLSLRIHQVLTSVRGKRHDAAFELPSVKLGVPRIVWILGSARSKRRLARIFFSGRDDGDIRNLERLVRKTVKSEEERELKGVAVQEEEEKPPNLVPAVRSVYGVDTFLARGQHLLNATRIFAAMMNWVALFFIMSIWEENSPNFRDPGIKKKRRGRRK